jgi:hypothetical protein
VDKSGGTLKENQPSVLLGLGAVMLRRKSRQQS